jgi:DNA primase large subunit
LNISPELLFHYPWLPSLEDFYSDLSNPIDFLKKFSTKYQFNEFESRILNLFRSAFDNLEEVNDFKSDELNAYLYIFTKILLYLLDNKRIANRIANLYSKQTYKELLNDTEDANLYDICKDLNLNVKYGDLVKFKEEFDKGQKQELKTRFKIQFKDYLRLSIYLRDDNRKLCHKALVNGYVYLEEREIKRLLQEYVRRKFMIEDVEDKNALETFKKEFFTFKDFKSIYDNILNEWDLKKEEFEYSVDIHFEEGKEFRGLFPPCIKEILTKAEEGQNLIHIERLYLVFFLHALNFPNESIIEIFKGLPDFDRKQTEYQVEFAKKKGYTPHSCNTLKSLNLCMAIKYQDPLCLNGYNSKKFNEQRKIKHPLFYVQYHQFKKIMMEKRQKESIKKENESN